MKKQVLLMAIAVSSLFMGCQKDSKPTVNDKPADDLIAMNAKNRIYTDTTTKKQIKSTTPGGKQVNDAWGDRPVITAQVLYQGGQNYQITWDASKDKHDIKAVYLNSAQPGLGAAYNFENDAGIFLYSMTQTLAPGPYQVRVRFSTNTDDVVFVSDVFNIAAQPAAPPAGMHSLYRYLNSTSTYHFYTIDWGELGGYSQNYHFEKVTGYLYATNIPGTTPIYRYLNLTNGEHFYSIKTPPVAPAGYKYESLIGYIYTTPTGDATSVLRRYNSDTHGHFYCTPDEIVTDPAMIYESDMGYIQLPNN